MAGQRFNFDVLIIGPSRGFDLTLAEHLSGIGLKVVVLKPISEKKKMLTAFSNYYKHYPPAKIIWVENRFGFLRYAWKSRLIVSFSGQFLYYIRFLWPVRFFLGLPPVVQWFTGSDGSELMAERSWRGGMFRDYLRFASLNIAHPYPHTIKNYIEQKTPNLVFIRYPYFLPKVKQRRSSRKRDATIRFLHASHLDWGISNKGESRNSTKGNDRFIRAFGRAIKSGLKAECIILDRGSDRELAKRLISELKLEKHFIWKQHLSRNGLIQEMSKADVVVDQFDVGAYGGIAIEAMALAKPVLVYINLAANKLLFDDPPPVLNARSEDEIYNQIKLCSDRSYRRSIGEAAKAWAYKYQGPQSYLPLFLFYYSLLTGHQIEDYGLSEL